MKISDYVESQIKGLWGTDFDENGIPVIKTNNLTYEGNIDYSEICKRNITKEQAKGCYLRPGDLLIEKSGGTKTHSVGYVSYFEGDENKFVCNNFILALRPKNTINSKFLFYQIQFKYESNQFSDCFNKTTGIQNLKVKDYLAKEIKIYSPEEQEKIVKELDTVRSTSNKNKQILEKYDTLIKSRFIEMFSSQKDSFSFCTLDTVSSRIFAGGDRPKETSETKNDEFQYPVFANAETNKGLLCYSKTYQVELPCVTIAARGCTVGYTEVRNEKFTPVVRLLTIIPTKEIKPLFLKYYLDLEMKIEGNGAAQPQLTVPTVKKYQIYVPSLTLQNDFATFVHQIDKSKFAVQKSLEKAETLYKSLMQEYFG